MIGSWLNGLMARISSSPLSSLSVLPERICRPRLEELEDRSVPSYMFVTSGTTAAMEAATIFPPNLGTINNPRNIVPNIVQAGVFTNAFNVIGINSGVVIGGFDVGILPGVYFNQNPGPTNNSTFSFHFIPNGSKIQFSVVMASDEYDCTRTPPAPNPAPDQAGVYLNGIQKGYFPGGNLLNPAGPTPLSPVTLPGISLFGPPDPRVIINGSFFGPGASSAFEMDAAGWTIPLKLTLNVRAHKDNSLTFATSEGYDNQFPTWLFISPIKVFQGPHIVTYNPYNWVYQPASNSFQGLITITNTGDLALTATTALYVVIPGLPAGSVFIGPGATFLPGTSTPAVKLPILSINPGQVYQLNVLVTDPYNLPLPSFFSGTPIVYAF
jgi:hypothetical protein